MSLWKANSSLANNTPKFGAEMLDIGSGKANQSGNNTNLFDNVSPAAFSEASSNSAIGMFGASPQNVQNTTGEGNKVTHAGWNLRRAFMGGVISANGAGSGYTNLGVVQFTSTTTGTTNGSGILSTNSLG